MANPNLVVTKSANLDFADIGTTVTYTIGLSNVGGTADVINIILSDLIPQGENFITNSVYIDGVNQTSVDPAIGITVPTIPIGSTAMVSLSAQVVNIPVLNPMPNHAQIDFQYLNGTIVTSSLVNSNTVLTTINTATLTLTKTAPSIIALGDVLTFTVNVSNVGTTSALNVTLLDTIPAGTTYVPGSATINGVPAPNSPAPPTGINVGTLPNGYYYNLVFKVNVVSLPSSQSITNYCDATYSYLVDPTSTASTSKRVTSNVTTSSVGYASLSSITLIGNSSYVKCGDIITFTVSIPNTGNSTALNVSIIDTIPNGMTFVSNSVTINGVTIPGVSPAAPTGLSVGTISAGQTSVVKFNMRVSC